MSGKNARLLRRLAARLRLRGQRMHLRAVKRDWRSRTAEERGGWRRQIETVLRHPPAERP